MGHPAIPAGTGESPGFVRVKVQKAQLHVQGTRKAAVGPGRSRATVLSWPGAHSPEKLEPLRGPWAGTGTVSEHRKSPSPLPQTPGAGQSANTPAVGSRLPFPLR